MKSYKFLSLGILLLSTLTLIVSCDNRTLKPETFFITNISAKPDTIYADNGITYSDISVTVKDDENFAVTGQEVRFRTSLGNILYTVYTDSTGIAHSTFWDDGTTGTARIDAFIGDVNATTYVEIEDAPPIEAIQITAPDAMVVGNVTQLRANITNSLGPVPDNTLILFETDLGSFQLADGTDLGSVTQIKTSNGIARVYFNCGTHTGVATISVAVSNVFEQAIIPINPGTPQKMNLIAVPNQLQVNSGEEALVTATVLDIYDNRIGAGVGVTFTTSIGNITGFSATDTDGKATAVFSPGVQSGLAQIDAVADSASASTIITVFSSEVYSINFAFAGQVDIQIQGTGGNESFETVVHLYDSNGNLIDQDVEVWFKFMTAPIGANINNQIYYPSPDSLSVLSDNGNASVSVNSGQNPGTISLKAYVFNSTGQEISAQKSNIVVHAGPPNSVNLVIGGNDTAQDMGGGVWQIQCSAIINDAWGNPVDYGTAVWFSLEDPNFPGQDPDWATIGAEAYVGNQNVSGDSLSGVAYTYLNYNGSHTNDSLYVWVEVSGQGQIFTDSTLVYMPIQYPSIDLLATPSHLDWNTQTNNQDSLATVVRVLVKDGQNNPINGQIVHFASTLGLPYSPGGGDPYLGTTANVNGMNGMLFKTFYFQKYECPPPVPAPPGTTEATITAILLGSGVSNQVTVTLNRYID